MSEITCQQTRINCISPGGFRAPMNEPYVDQVISRISYGVMADSSDMNGLVLYVSSNEIDSYVTGSCVAFDDGISCGGKLW
ncbi:MAG TPA: hypothetical protein QF353_01865 [Gammaproteobacteria bacterium]|nr:hypothetical protein [Gammaproteobacteria bacterium]